jgi:hypothetical protein
MVEISLGGRDAGQFVRLGLAPHSPASSRDWPAYALAFAGPMEDGVCPCPDMAPRPRNPSRERDD